jgi:hypothetical protein
MLEGEGVDWMLGETIELEVLTVRGLEVEERGKGEVGLTIVLMVVVEDVDEREEEKVEERLEEKVVEGVKERGKVVDEKVVVEDEEELEVIVVERD